MNTLHEELYMILRAKWPWNSVGESLASHTQRSPKTQNVDVTVVISKGERSSFSGTNRLQ